MTATDILDFWFKELKPEQWFMRDDSVDMRILQRFAGVYDAAMKCELFAWRKSPLGRLAEIIILDQFSRNMFRGTAKAFSGDSLALALSQEAIANGADKELKVIERVFLYMPFMHSESKEIHRLAVQVFSAPGMEENLAFELKHKKIIDKFGRYPHRNLALGRTSTPAEIEFLTGPDSSF